MADPIRAAEEISRVALLAPNREDALHRVVDLLVEHFGLFLAAIFLVDEASQNAVLVDAAGEDEAALAVQEIKKQGLQIALGSDLMVGMAASQNQVRFATAVGEDIYHLPEDLKLKIRSAASLPISSGDRVWGVLDVQQTDLHALDADLVAVLKTITHHLAAILKNFSLLEAADLSQQEAAALSRAGRRIAQAGSLEEVMSIILETITSSAFPSLVVTAAGSSLQVGAVNPSVQRSELKDQKLNATRQDFEAQFANGASLVGCDFDQGVEIPECFAEIPNQLGWKTVTFIPVKRHGKIEMIFVFGGPRGGKLDQAVMGSYAVLAELTSTAFEKLSALQIMEKRMEALHTLNVISQAVSMETDIFGLYKVIHQEVVRVMGELDFLIATYDPAEKTIQIPYMYESGSYLTTEPFPVGEGLTSILIKTREPLMLVENTEAKAKELGAKVLGKPAKSWLGVPLLVAGEVTGAMVVQDLEHEQRFDEDDLRVLSTLASQVAVAIRNTRLLESTHKQAERERLLFEITNKIRLASDMKTIMATTATELREALKARQAGIKIGVDAEETSETQFPDDGQIVEHLNNGSNL